MRVAVLTGTGKFFCSGADLKDRPNADKAGDFLDHNRVTRETGNAIRECAKPVIAAINGPALGAGFGLMAAVRHLPGSRGRHLRHARDQRRPGRRRVDAADAVRPLVHAPHVLHRHAACRPRSCIGAA